MSEQEPTTNAGEPGKQDDGYGHTVYGNILDNYALPTYNLKLYMMEKALSEDAEAGVASHDPSLTTDDASKMVIIAQTGVTATTIDNLEIQTLIATEKHNAVGLKFTITQPGAVTFLDQLHLSRIYLNQPRDPIPVIFLEVSFKGYSADVENEDGGEYENNEDADGAGKLTQDIVKPLRWKLFITAIDIEVNAGGSVYNIEARPVKDYAYTSRLYKIPEQTTTQGTTITEHVTSLKEVLNKWHQESVDNHTPDQFEFDLTSLIGTGADGTVGPLKIADEKLITTDDQDTDDVNRYMNETFAIGDAVEKKKIQLEKISRPTPGFGLDTDKGPEQVFAGDALKITKGTTIEKYFAMLLSMNNEFYGKISNLVDMDDPATEVKEKGGEYKIWFKVDATTEQLVFDHLRGEYARKITYRPHLYRSSREDIILKTKEANTTVETQNERLEGIIAGDGLMKAYHYLFTGLNDQIENLDIKYDPGIAFLVPPAGGALGVGANVLDYMEGAVAIDRDVTTAGVVEEVVHAAKLANAVESFKGLLDKFSELAAFSEGAEDGFIQNLIDQTGMDIEDIKSAVVHKNELNRKKLDGALDAKAKLDIISKTGPEGTGPVEVEEIDYLEENSDSQYAVDLVNPLETPLTAEEIEQLGYLKLTEDQIAKGRNDLVLQSAVVTGGEVDSAAQAATTKKGSLKNNLFGVIASQRANDSRFLVTAVITLRGDPWYLGTDAEPDEPSTPEQANWGKDDNHMMLTIRSPKTFDMDWRDEDSDINSGYWKTDGVSRAFSGLYRITRCTNMFSGGVYTVEIQTQRLQMAMPEIKPPPPKTAESSNPTTEMSSESSTEGTGETP